MLMNRLLKYSLLVTLLFISHCSTFYGGATNSEGTQSISNTPTEINFESNVGTATYQSVTFTNRTTRQYEITNLAFVDNLCGSFSVFNVFNGAGQNLYSEGNTISIDVDPGATVTINIQFSPASCEFTDYSSVFIIYYLDNETTQRTEAITLTALVSDNTPPVITCEESQSLTYYDEFDNPTIRTLPPLTDNKPYYLKIEKLSTYIQTTGEFIIFATQVGTSINQEFIPIADRYQPIYIPITTDAAGQLTVSTIDECTGLELPSPITDTFFIGASVFVKTKNEFLGTIQRSDDTSTARNEIGQIDIPNIQFNLSSFINNSNSLLQDAEGFFEINVKINNLTTGETETNSFAEDLSNIVDDEGEQFLSIINGRMVGKNIRHGTVRLVGIGTFVDDEDAKLSNEGRTGIIENEAYLFIQIDGVITQEFE